MSQNTAWSGRDGSAEEVWESMGSILRAAPALTPSPTSHALVSTSLPSAPGLV
ncbi:hypothetical protein GCM10009674_01160 [Nesterenkonia xinjiangensis]